MNGTKKMVYMSLLIAMALVLGLFENMLPSIILAPGARLGLANIITVIALYTLDYKDTFCILILRIVLSCIFGGGISRLMYSISGGILSYCAMALLKKFFNKHVSIFGISIMGAAFHNFGQVIVAAFVMGNIGIMLYLPIMTIVAIVTGTFIGFTAYFCIRQLKKINNGE